MITLAIGLLALLVDRASDAPRHPPRVNEPDAVACKVQGLTQLRWVRPSGERVRAGDRLCELDPTAPRERLLTQTARVEQCRRELRRATLEREAAELALEEVRAIDAEARATAVEALRLATAGRDLARLALDEARAAQPADDMAIRAAEEALRRAEARLEAAAADARRLAVAGATAGGHALADDVAAAEARVRDAKARLDVELERAGRLQEELDACTIVAPSDGTAVHARWRPRGDERGYATLEPGAFVREGQVLFRIIPDPEPAPRRAGG